MLGSGELALGCIQVVRLGCEGATGGGDKAGVMSKLCGAEGPGDIRAAVLEHLAVILPGIIASKVGANTVIEYCKTKLTVEALVQLGTEPEPPSEAITLMNVLTDALPTLADLPTPAEPPMAIMTLSEFHKTIGDLDIHTIDESTCKKLQEGLASASVLRVGGVCKYLLALLKVVVGHLGVDDGGVGCKEDVLSVALEACLMSQGALVDVPLLDLGSSAKAKDDKDLTETDDTTKTPTASASQPAPPVPRKGRKDKKKKDKGGQKMIMGAAPIDIKALREKNRNPGGASPPVSQPAPVPRRSYAPPPWSSDDHGRVVVGSKNDHPSIIKTLDKGKNK